MIQVQVLIASWANKGPKMKRSEINKEVDHWSEHLSWAAVPLVPFTTNPPSNLCTVGPHTFIQQSVSQSEAKDDWAMCIRYIQINSRLCTEVLANGDTLSL